MPLRSLLKRARQKLTMGLTTLSLLPTAALAQDSGLPEMDPPSSGDGGGLMENLQGYIYDGFVLGGLILAAASFIWVGIACLKSFNEARDGKGGDWSKFGVTLVVGIGLILAIIWLTTQAAPILQQ